MRLPEPTPAMMRGGEIVGSMIVTIAVLFALQWWYGSYTAIAAQQAQVSTGAD